MTAPVLELEAAACPGCADTACEPVYEAEDFVYRVDPRAFPFVRCSGCALVYLGRRPTRAAIAAAYPANYLWRIAAVDARGSGLDARIGALWFRQLYARRARFAARLLAAAPARVLELGCGEGHFLAALAARRGGRDAYVGVDFVVPAAAPPLSLIAGDVEVAGPAEGSFDMVCLWHVLEHLHDPCRALETAHARLSPGGRLLIGTQNFDALSRRLKGPRWPFNDVPRHLVHFTPATLAALVRRAGFEVERVSHLSEMFPSMGGFLFPGLALHDDGRLAALPGIALSAAFLPIEALAIAAGRGCVFNLVARKQLAAPAGR